MHRHFDVVYRLGQPFDTAFQSILNHEGVETIVFLVKEEINKSYLKENK